MNTAVSLSPHRSKNYSPIVTIEGSVFDHLERNSEMITWTIIETAGKGTRSEKGKNWKPNI